MFLFFKIKDKCKRNNNTGPKNRADDWTLDMQGIVASLLKALLSHGEKKYV